MYRTLQAEGIIQTAEQLRRRIVERFPDSGLGRVAAELLVVAREAQGRSEDMVRPHKPLRIGAAAVISLILLGLGVGLIEVDPHWSEFDLAEFVQVLEAGINALVLIGGAIFFLVTGEARIKRSRVLKATHELRALAHVVDMHQLAKDPDRILCGPSTASSPDLQMTPYEMTRYLNYCSEMLSLIGKIAAYYVQRFEDPVAEEAVNELEDLTTGLARKVWQKIMIVHQMQARRDDTSRPSLV